MHLCDIYTFSMSKYSPEIRNLVSKIVLTKHLPGGLRQKCISMISRLIKVEQAGKFSEEFESISQYIDWVCSIPWNVYSDEQIELDQARSILDKYNYGLEQVKQRVLEYLAVLKLKNFKADTNRGSSDDIVERMRTRRGNSSNAPVLCFVGIQGVGKTSIAKAIAIALRREFIRIALGGLGSITEIRGLNRGEPNSEPGQIIKSLVRAKTMNPVILLDEIDKVSSDSGLRADVMAALLEILDPEQNSSFMDKYIDYPVDLSRVIFITTANNLGGISAALLDRLEVIRFGSYSDNEKIIIAKNYLLPKVLEAAGLSPEVLSFEEDVWPLVIRPLGFDAGVRQLERTLMDLARKTALRIVQGQGKKFVITKDNFRQFIPEDIGVYS
ncbi:AAA family ATPase [Candidatus Dojkabacteria bacterium]|uniref:AAA family ATPase n=1 Tax=Candidatus Dojkabacteria bacterium TaxID=2099670 RepID=A0A3M0YYK7_9BACT|nr:MAG: AAA family ATPase [Candidatus Dojkabacteria bacterium]